MQAERASLGVSAHTEVRCNFRLCLPDKKPCDSSCYLLAFRVCAARRGGQRGLAGTGRFAALRRRGTMDVAVPGAASEPSPAPCRRWACRERAALSGASLPHTHNGFLTSKIKAQGMNSEQNIWS